VVAGLLGRDAAGRVVDEHHLEQVQALLVQVGTQRHRRIANPRGEGGLEVGVAGDAGPDVFGGSAEEAGGKRLAGTLGERKRKTYRKILKISSISESPGKSGLRVHISAKMQPTDHMSTPVEY
jgi:hypothetical protein